MEEMPSQNTPVHRLKVAILPLDLPCSGLVTHSGDISITGKFHKIKNYTPKDRGNQGRPLKTLLDA
jgi:hypothetical protein